EVAGGCGYFKWELHRLIQRQNFDRSRSNTKKPGECSCAKHQPKAFAHRRDQVRTRAFRCWIGAMHAQSSRKRVRADSNWVLWLAAAGNIPGIKQHNSEYDCYSFNRSL